MAGRRRSARGISLVELLVALALGLFLLGQGLVLLTLHLMEHRDLTLQARLVQDLRSAALALARDLRRAGHWGNADDGLWRDDAPARSNPYRALAPEGAASDSARLHYSRDAVENDRVDTNEAFGYRLRNQAVDVLLGGSWQTLTDPASVRVTGLRVTPETSELEQPGLCDRPCPASAPAAAACPPRVRVSHLTIEITGMSPADASVQRTLRTSARVRNDAVIGACP